MERLAALIPAPRFNMIRYSGVLAPSAAWRGVITPKEAVSAGGAGTEAAARDDVGAQGGKPKTAKSSHNCKRRYAWSELLKRVFAVDALKCDRCGNTMKILCAVNPPDVIRKILECIGLPSRPPPIFPPVIRDEDEYDEYEMYL